MARGLALAMWFACVMGLTGAAEASVVSAIDDPLRPVTHTLSDSAAGDSPTPPPGLTSGGRLVGLTAREAAALARSTPGILSTALWNPRRGAGADAAPLSLYVARLERAGGDRPSRVVTSTTPLATRERDGRLNWINLAVQEGRGAFRSVNPVVEVTYPGSSAEPVRFNRSAVAVAPEAMSDVRALEDDGHLVYANGWQDTDLVLRPQPLGAQFIWQLRSPKSPAQLGLKVSMPAAARLEPVSDGQARIVDGAQELLRVSAPAAWDAVGRPVTVSAEVDGSRLVYRVEHRNETVSYPVVVDPYWIETSSKYYGWSTGGENATSYHGWESFKDHSAWQPYSGSGGHGNGLYVRKVASDYYYDGSSGGWRVKAQGNSWVAEMELGNAWHDPDWGMCFSYGIRRADLTGWEPYSAKTHCDRFDNVGLRLCLRNYCGDEGLQNTPYPDARGTFAEIRETAVGAGTRRYHSGYVGTVKIIFADDDVPVIRQNLATTEWTNQPHVQLRVLDHGLGVYSYSVKRGSQEIAAFRQESSCVPKCDSSVEVNLRSQLPEGVYSLQATATDIGGGHTSEPFTTSQVRVDRTPPQVSLGGSLYDNRRTTEHPDRQVPDQAHELTVSATDGLLTSSPTADQRRSGVDRVLVDVCAEAPRKFGDPPCSAWDQERTVVNTGCSADNCALAEQRLSVPLEDYDGGDREFRVRVQDRAGNVDYTSLFVRLPPRPDLSVDSAVYERRGSPVHPDVYDLSIDAQPSDPSRADSGIALVEVYVDGQLAHSAHPDDSCLNEQCDVDTSYDLDASAFVGNHSIEIRARDRSGRVRRLSWVSDFSGVPMASPQFEELAAIAPQSPDGESASASAGEQGCPFLGTRDAAVLIDIKPARVVHGRWRTFAANGAETTERFPGGRYRVTRCDGRGRLVISQLVGPVPTPGGVELLELGRTLPAPSGGYASSTIEYASPQDPRLRREWPKVRGSLQAGVLPATGG